VSAPVRLLVAITAGVVLVAGCAEYRIERNGKDAGEAVCDLRNADNEEEVRSALEDLEEQLDDARRIVGRPVSEDVDDVEENVADLAAHIIDDQENLAEQDIAAIRRNMEAATSRTRSAVQRFYEGAVQGLGECSD
jgi:hypothetical protein